jgi:hypothetical protein
MELNVSSIPVAAAEAPRQRLGKASVLARLALIGAALAAVIGTFAYVGGWLTPSDLTPARLTDAFEHVDGVHSGFRRNHATLIVPDGLLQRMAPWNVRPPEAASTDHAGSA